jgi:hypothetical protein
LLNRAERTRTLAVFLPLYHECGEIYCFRDAEEKGTITVQFCVMQHAVDSAKVADALGISTRDEGWLVRQTV